MFSRNASEITYISKLCGGKAIKTAKCTRGGVICGVFVKLPHNYVVQLPA